MENKKIDLTSDDKKIIQSLKKDYDKFKGLIIAGVFSILVGAIIGGSTLFLSIDKSYTLAGIFFMTIGIFTIRDSMRNKKFYQLLKKLLEGNQQ
jgi:uncharacterized membrane protein HdeD (DUF308 family)